MLKKLNKSIDSWAVLGTLSNEIKGKKINIESGLKELDLYTETKIRNDIIIPINAVLNEATAYLINSITINADTGKFVFDGLNPELKAGVELNSTIGKYLTEGIDAYIVTEKNVLKTKLEVKKRDTNIDTNNY